MFKLPAAYICGVRLRNVSETTSNVQVTHRWINQNPFRSMYFAVQAMAAELTTGSLVMYHIKDSAVDISMLIIAMNSEYFKKATGKIDFTCQDGNLVVDAISRMKVSGVPQTIVLTSRGVNKHAEIVSEFEFHWSLRLRNVS